MRLKPEGQMKYFDRIRPDRLQYGPAIRLEKAGVDQPNKIAYILRYN